jgi:hypothetical protein
MNKIGEKQIEQSRMSLVDEAARALEQLQKGEFTPTLLTFWGSKGMGKTRLLKSISQSLGEKYPSLPIQFLNVENMQLDEIKNSLASEVKGVRVILLDNIDDLLRRSTEGDAFFEFEQEIVLPLIERAETLIIATSQIELNQWREDDIRVRLLNIQIPAWEEYEVAAMAKNAGMDANEVYALTFGQPKAVSWLLKTQTLSAKELAGKAAEYFLEGIPDDAREIADIICLMPIFNAFVVQKMVNSDPSRPEVPYMQCLKWLKEYIRRGLVVWDVSIGSYRFTDSAVRRLLARWVLNDTPDRYQKIQQMAWDYFQEEARGPGYLHLHLVSAVYHRAQTMRLQASREVGETIFAWVQNNLDGWRSARWGEVLAAWQGGAGEEAVRQEIEHLIGVKYFSAIEAEIIKASRTMEETL